MKRRPASAGWMATASETAVMATTMAAANELQTLIGSFLKKSAERTATKETKWATKQERDKP
jgi:hypothetical protein